MDDDEYEPLPNNNELAAGRTDLAFERSRMASDRTTLGYMRTSISLIGFGFSIPALFQILTGVPGLEDTPVERARLVGVSMLGLAVFMLLVAIVQQVAFLRRLSEASRAKFPISVALVSSFLVLMVALIATVSILLQIGS